VHGRAAMGKALIYKILLPPEWEEFDTLGVFGGSPFDRASGFIHCSSRAQVGATARRVFRDDPALVVVAIDPGPLGDALRWEPSPDGGWFPHVYAPLTRSAVVRAHRVVGAALVDRQLEDDGTQT
jgi:uncharacterized protein (DUF952 family)